MHTCEYGRYGLLGATSFSVYNTSKMRPQALPMTQTFGKEERENTKSG
jgi:hypothetical protein